MSEATEVCANVHVGGQETTCDYILKHGIKKIICCEASLHNRYRTGTVRYFNLSLADTPSENIARHFDAVYSEIASAQGPVLIQCRAGVSRSGTLAIMHVMRSQRCSLFDAVVAVKKKRPIVKPNLGFFKQLIAFETKARKEASMTVELYDHL
eukprot:TRINITY_DN12188_c0_g1_i1.p1 TRINITY_DN12188_c0_g1~~TRINITY_DN12188_c0_g1_i1.p1  ORF type:complete len:153 (+),score=55.11 TRINITY_DN12188_c0_g1_i1:53-511(+)